MRFAGSERQSHPPPTAAALSLKTSGGPAQQQQQEEVEEEDRKFNRANVRLYRPATLASSAGCWMVAHRLRRRHRSAKRIDSTVHRFIRRFP